MNLRHFKRVNHKAIRIYSLCSDEHKEYWRHHIVLFAYPHFVKDRIGDKDTFKEWLRDFLNLDELSQGGYDDGGGNYDLITKSTLAMWRDIKYICGS